MASTLASEGTTPMSKPADDVVHAINFRVSRAEYTGILAAQREMEADFGAGLPVAQVVRRMVRAYIASMPGESGRKRRAVAR